MELQIESSTKYLIESKWIFIISLIVIITTIIGVWLFGIGYNRTLFVNSILSTTILSIIFFLFVTIGLYKGITLKDNLSEITDNIDPNKIPNIEGLDFSDSEIPEMGEEIGSIILGILSWIFISIILFVLLWVFSAVLWICVLSFMAMLYWIFYSALKVVFNNSVKCKSNFLLSAVYGLTHTLLYNCWIYFIIYFTHNLNK